MLASALIGAGPGRRSDGDDEEDRSDPPSDGDAPARKDSDAKKDGEAPKGGSALGNWNLRMNAETSFYADTDHVSVVSPTAGFGLENPLTGWTVGGSYLVDVVSAASADIVATATPRWKEIRHAVGASVGYKPGNFGVAVSGSASIEPDYLSMTGGGTLTWDLFEKNVTAMFGYGYGHDIAGLHEVDFASPYQLDRHQINGGAAWTVDRATLATLVGDVVLEQGEQSKLYRHVPMFLPGNVDKVTAGASIDLVNQLRSDERPREQLPLNRQRFALTGRLAHRFVASTIRVEERAYIDSWALAASTTDLRVLWDVGSRFSFGPRARFHIQTGTDFWQRAYSLVKYKGVYVPPKIRTGDRELGPMYTFSGGLGANLDLSSSAGEGGAVLSLVVDGIYTAYEDAIYVTDRTALFGALTFNAAFE
ncbi:MAG: DUF3570 domain-containing protein [Polyangiaceae bacterium]